MFPSHDRIQYDGSFVDFLDTTRVRAGNELRCFDSGNTKHIRITHNGTNGVIDCDAGSFSIGDSLFVNRTSAEAVAILAGGSNDHCYYAWYADSAAQSTRSGFIGYQSAGTDVLTLNNEQGDNIAFGNANKLNMYDSGGSESVTFEMKAADFQILTTQGIWLNPAASHFAYVFDSGETAQFRVYGSTGASDHLRTYHDGTDSYLVSGTGGWNVDSDDTGATLDTNDLRLTTSNSNADEPGYKGTPTREQNLNYTFVLADAGKRIRKASGGAGETYTIPANASVAFPVGTVIVVDNDGGGDLSIAITTDTLEEYGTGLTGTRTLPDNNKAILEKVDTTLWKYSATG